MAQLSLPLHAHQPGTTITAQALRAAKSTLKAQLRTIVAHSPVRVHVAARAMKKYRYTYGYWPNVLFPRTFNEKLQARKIFDHRAIFAVWVDKVAVRSFVADMIGVSILPRLYHVTRNPDDIPFHRLPRRYVVKASHGSGWVQLVRDAESLDRQALIDTCREWLSLNYYDINQEPFYRKVTPRIIVEEFLEDESGEVPNDLKFYVFGGKVRFVQIDVARFGEHRRNIYDPEWNLLPVKLTVEPCLDGIERPALLGEMIRVAETLAGGTDFVRVDLYESAGRVYFGEMTPSSGNGFNTFTPASYDAVFGSFWVTHGSRSDPGAW